MCSSSSASASSSWRSSSARTCRLPRRSSTWPRYPCWRPAQAFTEAYGRGRFGHWLLGLLFAVVVDLVASLIEQLFGTTGQLLSILLSPAVLWLSTALAFAIYRTHSLDTAPAEIIS